MARRQAGAGPHRPPRRRWGVFSLAALAVLAAAAWLTPAVLVHTSLRDKPLVAALAGIDGSIASRAARWSWLGPSEYRDVVLRDASGEPVVVVQSLVIEKGILPLALDPTSLGTVRLAGVEAAVAVRRGGSSLEDLLAPWLAAPRGGPGMACDLEVAGATVELADVERRDAWRVVELFAAGTLERDGSLAGWTAAGRLRHAGAAAAPSERAVAGGPLDSRRLDRATLPAATAAVLARDGGWSVSAPAGSRQAIAITANRLPLGGTSLLATRFHHSRLLDGLADLRLDLVPGAGGSELRGRIVIDQLAVVRSDTLAEEFTLARCELPLSLTLSPDAIAVHELRFTSPVARGEVSGRVAWPEADSWRWLEDCVGRDLSVAAEIDLAAAARALPGGLAVRPEVQVTGGSLWLSALTRGDGADRVLEAKLEARDLAAVRRGVAREGDDADGPGRAGDRPLRWNEPFTAWLRARRGPGRGAGLRIEEARIASAAAELSAAGTPAALKVQWTADVGGLVGDLAEVLDFGGVTLAGTCRGRLDLERASGGLTAVKLTASVNDFELALPGRQPWQDASLALDIEGSGSQVAGGTLLETGRGMLSARGDALEATLAGGVVIDLAGWAAGRRGWLVPAGGEGSVAADCSLVGDLGRWQRRLGTVLPALGAPGLDLAGSVQAAAAVAADPAAGGDAWRITKAGGEIERFTLRHGDRRVAEPRIVVTAAGTIKPAAGSVEISSAELLSSTLSLRSGGVSWAAPPAGSPATAGQLEAMLAGTRGRVQWQADLGRLSAWLVAADMAAAWPVTGRAWGTLDVAETQQGLNLLAAATASQLEIARRADAKSSPRAVWSEPQASISCEVTRPLIRTAGLGGQSAGLAPADRLVIDRLELASSTLAVTARGGIADWSSRRQTTLEGTVAYDWEQLSRLATPWTGGRVRASGSGARPFVIRVPLAAAGGTTRPAPPPPAPGTLPLPEEWLEALSPAGAAERRATVRPPVQLTVARRLAEQLSLDTSAAWDSADLAGLPVAAGEVAIRLFEGQLAVGPFDLSAGGGRIRGAPWLKLVPAPGELVVPPGRVVERVGLGGEFCDRFVGLVSPLFAGATRSAGVISVDLAGARLPLGDPLAGEGAGQLIFEQFEVRPSGAMQPLVNLLGLLQAAIDPRFALGDKVVLLRVRPEPVRLRLAERRIWHEGLVMDFGQLTVSSRGSVDEDGSLAALVEVAFRGELAGQTPVVTQLLQTPIAIPLKGTLARPQFDAGAIDVTVKRILENTARAVLDDGLSRGLEAMFGSPPPSPPPGGPGRR
jgi:hypothetical protein